MKCVHATLVIAIQLTSQTAHVVVKTPVLVTVIAILASATKANAIVTPINVAN